MRRRSRNSHRTSTLAGPVVDDLLLAESVALAFAEFDPAGLPRRRLWEFVDVLDTARLLVRRRLFFHVRLEPVGEFVVAVVPLGEHDVRLDDVPSFLVGRSDRAASVTTS